MPDGMWITKQQAAECLGVSTKQIERLVADKKLECVKWTRPEGGPAISIYPQEQVDRIGREKQTVAVRQPTAEQFAQTIATLVSDIRRKSEVQLRLWLTVREAATYSGMPARVLYGWINCGRLPAEDIGVRRRLWRIRRVDLESVEPVRDVIAQLN